MPDETAHERLVDAFTDALEAAVEEGQRIATDGKAQHGLISAAKNLAGRVVQAIAGIVTQLRKKIESIIGNLFGSDEAIDLSDDELEAAESELNEWAEEYSDMVAVTEIQAAVEEAVVDELMQNGTARISWMIEKDDHVCPVCQANAKASPIPIGSKFPSGDTAPPAHPRCRCSVAPA